MWVYPIVADVAASMVADLVAWLALALGRRSLGPRCRFDLILPAAVLNAAIAGLLLCFVQLAALMAWCRR